MIGSEPEDWLLFFQELLPQGIDRPPFFPEVLPRGTGCRPFRPKVLPRGTDGAFGQKGMQRSLGLGYFWPANRRFLYVI